MSIIAFLKKCVRSYRHYRFVSLTTLPSAGKLIDVSCADGLLLGRIRNQYPKLELFGLDISVDEIEKAHKNYPQIHFDIAPSSAIPHPDNTFDAITCLLSLHHFAEAEKVFSEFERILKNNGKLFLVDLIPKYSWSHKVWNHHKCPEPYHFEKYYSKSEIEAALAKHNMELVETKRLTIVPRLQIFIFRLHKINSFSKRKTLPLAYRRSGL